MYDYTSPADLCRWAEQQLNRQTFYQLGGIGRYDTAGRRVFDCVGLIKCFLWHDYGPGNASYYGKTAPDINADQMYSRADVKGSIDTIPDIPGLLVWQSGHIGIYIGGGQVIEATAKRWGSIGGCVVKSQFINKSVAMYRGTWTHWLRCPFLIYEEGSKMYLKPGYQSIAWQGQTIHVYKRKDDQEIGLMSAGGDKVLKTIDKIDDDHIHHCKVNCSYFVMSGSERGTVCGRHQGFTADGRPDQSEWLDVVVTKDNKLIAGDLASWEYPGDEVKVGYSPAVILMLEGKDVTRVSSGSGQSKYSTANTQTLHMRDADGVDVFAVVSGKLNGIACRQFAKAYGMTYCAMLDSGGSSQMIVDGTKKVYTGRALPNVLTFYKTEAQAEPDPQPEPTPEPADGLSVVVDSVGLRVRKTLSFTNGRASGEILATIPIGGTAKLIRFLPGIKPDGYQWVEAEYNGIRGYCQYDSRCYWIKEED